ncbi:RNA export factor gle2 [Coemansia brasiliensis]|uniref:RNA export factor gle2 n=1 Tax=Coemansia brasiliensis TaxID=2650707 RepID=A0A9W8IA35_9FUNG|nr:RNA export factor gle2 [Coemansia brasiliensis]
MAQAALKKLPAMNPHSVFKSLEWVESAVWDLTGLPDAFVTLLMHCSSMSSDSEDLPMHEGAALESLGYVESAGSLYDSDGPFVLKAAIKRASTDQEFASMLASLCDTYYFLRSLNVFSLSSQEFDGLVDLLQADVETDAPLYTHADAVGLINVYLDKLEYSHPGIKHYANCAMLEANIVQELDTSYDLMHRLRDQLPQDGDLYMATLRSILASARENATIAQAIEKTRRHYEGASSIFWDAASNAIWDMYAGADDDIDTIMDEEIELLEPSSSNLKSEHAESQTRMTVQSNGSSLGKASFSHKGPALCCAWSQDGSKVVSGGADKAGQMIDLATGQTTQVAQHDAPIRCVKFVEAENSSPIIATAGWDKQLRYWDTRQQTPIGTVNLPERAYAMDCNNPLLVVATAERKVLVFDMANPTTPFETIESPLKWQTRTVSCFAKKDGYAIGSIEGRVAIQYVDPKMKDKNFSFRCHRDSTSVPMKTLIYSVNSISTHPVYNTIATASNEGSFVIWDKDAKQRIKAHEKLGAPVLSTAFNGDGKLYAYALGYDWAQGYKGNVSSIKNTIMLHAVSEEDVKPKAK